MGWILPLARVLSGRFIFLLAIFHLTALAKVEDDKPIGWASQPGTGLENGTIGGQGGSIDTVSSTGAANGLLGKSGPAIVFLKGTKGGTISFGASNKTLIGLEGAQVGGVNIGGKSNIILRNITIRQGKCGSYGACRGGSDALRIGGSHHIWVDHCDIADGQDESISVTKGCDFITFTWNKIHYTYEKHHAYANLVASSDGDGGGYNLTYAYNWWGDNIVERMPRSRFGKIHVVNNLYTCQGNHYCVGIGKATNSRTENNAFLNVNMPVMIAANAAGGLITGNLWDTTSRDPNGTGSDFVPFQNFVAGNVFDSSFGEAGFTPPYKLDVMPASHVEEVVKKYAGAKLWSVPEAFKVPTETAGLMFSPVKSGNPSFPVIMGSRQIPAPWLEKGDYQIFDLQGKSVFLRNPAGMKNGIYFIQSRAHFKSTPMK